MRILYFDCFSGISGDMTVASLVDAGADRTYLEQELQKLNIEPFELAWTTMMKCGISSLKMDVIQLHPVKQHRHYSDIQASIREAGFGEQVVSKALAIFDKIAVAEAKIHDVPIEQVHFHEVGAIDSIVDIVATALALHNLQVDQIIASPIPLGSGTVRCDHGLYPVPAPATLEMMKGLTIAPSTHQVELTTPTGAAIIAATVDQFSIGIPPMKVEAVGYGAGTRDLPDQPNVLRTVIGQLNQQHQPRHGHGHGHLEHGHEHHEHGHEHHGHGHEHHGHKHEQHGHEHHGHGHKHHEHGHEQHGHGQHHEHMHEHQ